MKQLIGIFRIALVLILMYGFELPIMDPFKIQCWLSNLIHGAHTAEFRDSASVSLGMFVILGVMSFYIIQSFVYIFVGHALEGKNTGLFRFLGYVVSGLRECANDPYFWTSSSSNSDFSRIEDVLKYRDSRMKLMSNKEAAEFMRGTGNVEHLLNNKDLKRSRKVLSYMNNKMNLMDNECALEYLKNGSK
jgi:hypothetical protein